MSNGTSATGNEATAQQNTQPAVDDTISFCGGSVRMSAKIDQLAMALALAQGEMELVKKDADNPFFKSKYADFGAIVKAIGRVFAKHGLSYSQPPVSRQGHVGVLTVLMHKSGQWMTSEFYLPVAKNDPQGLGSALTYAKRYALAAIAGCATGDEDDDGEAATQAYYQQQGQQRPGPRQQYQQQQQQYQQRPAAQQQAQQRPAGK